MQTGIPQQQIEPAREIGDNPVPLDAVITTAELSRRGSRTADYEAENRALGFLLQELQEMTIPSSNVLQKLVETAMDLCKAHTAGISILEEEEGRQIFRWHAVAGEWASLLRSTMPRESSPCGTVLDRNSSLLMSHPERHYPFPPEILPPAAEALLVPFHVGGAPVGTLWVIAHDETRQFDREDQRLVASLARFASTVYQMLLAREALSTQIAERKHAEEAIRERERRFRQMIDALPAAIYTTDAAGRLTHFNPAAVEFSGRVPELGTDQWCVSWKLFRPDGTPLPHDECPMAVALKEGRAMIGAEAIAERPNGKRVWFAAYPMPLRDGNGQVVGGINMLVDITERKRTEEIHDRLAAIVESSDDAIISKDLQGIITSWNRGAERLFGYTSEEAIGRPGTILIPPDRFDEEPGILARIRRGEAIDHYETMRRHKDGTLLSISLTVSPVRDAHGKIVGASKIARDITERKRAEEELRRVNEELERFSMELEDRVAVRTAELAKTNDALLRTLAERDALEAELRQAQKMEAIGTMAGGIAHDFNNLLTIIMANAAELKDDSLKSDELSESIEAILTAASRGAAVVQQLLTFARSGSASRDSVNLDCLLREFATIIERTFPKTIELSLEIQPDLPIIRVNANQIQQVLFNLCINSRDAMPEGGMLAIRAAREVRLEPGAGEYIRISVADTGVGMDEEIQRRVFDPFFTTKQKTGGTGLGLAVVYGIVRNHGGFIQVNSAKYKGTEFRLFLPVGGPGAALENGG